MSSFFSALFLDNFYYWSNIYYSRKRRKSQAANSLITKYFLNLVLSTRIGLVIRPYQGRVMPLNYESQTQALFSHQSSQGKTIQSLHCSSMSNSP